jgi:3-phosphoinositide dependent protein kinase-1
LWSVGCMLYQLLTGRPPFRAPNEYLTFQKILNRQIVYPTNMSSQVIDLLDGLLVWAERSHNAC